MSKDIPQTYEEVKAFLETCHIHIEDHPNQKLHFSGFPYFRCTNWDELQEAVGHCSCPSIMGTMFGSKDKKMVMEYIDICDDFLWENAKYRWDLLDELDNTLEPTKIGDGNE